MGEPRQAEADDRDEPVAVADLVASVADDTWSPIDVWRAMFDAAPIPYSLLDADLRLSFANQPYLDLFGYSRDEMHGIHTDALTHPDDRAMTDEYHRRLASGEIDRFETDKRYLRRDGSVFLGHLAISVLR